MAVKHRRSQKRKAGVRHTRPNMNTLENLFSNLSLPNPVKAIAKSERMVVSDSRKVGTSVDDLMKGFAGLKIKKRRKKSKAARSAARSASRKGKGTRHRKKSRKHRKKSCKKLCKKLCKKSRKHRKKSSKSSSRRRHR